jgi:hypothetical protein
MEPSDEVLALLREIRDGQREMASLLRAWMQQSDRQYGEWREGSARTAQEFQSRRDDLDGAVARWQEANELWLRAMRRNQRAGLAVGLFVLACVGLLALALAVGWIGSESASRSPAGGGNNHPSSGSGR